MPPTKTANLEGQNLEELKGVTTKSGCGISQVHVGKKHSQPRTWSKPAFFDLSPPCSGWRLKTEERDEKKKRYNITSERRKITLTSVVTWWVLWIFQCLVDTANHRTRFFLSPSTCSALSYNNLNGCFSSSLKGVLLAHYLTLSMVFSGQSKHGALYFLRDQDQFSPMFCGHDTYEWKLKILLKILVDFVKTICELPIFYTKVSRWWRKRRKKPKSYLTNQWD